LREKEGGRENEREGSEREGSKVGGGREQREMQSDMQRLCQ